MVGLASGLILNHYKLALVHFVVEEATVRKASEVDREPLRAAFESARARAEGGGESEPYLQRLFEISRRVEKVQFLRNQEAREVLRILEGKEADPDEQAP